MTQETPNAAAHVDETPTPEPGKTPLQVVINVELPPELAAELDKDEISDLLDVRPHVNGEPV